MSKQNINLPNIKGQYGNLLINSEMPAELLSADNRDSIIIYHLVNAYKMLEKQNSQYTPPKPSMAGLSLSGQAEDLVKNALELLSVHNKQNLSYLIDTTSLSLADIWDFLEKWKKKHSISSKNYIYL